MHTAPRVTYTDPTQFIRRRRLTRNVGRLYRLTLIVANHHIAHRSHLPHWCTITRDAL